MNVRTSNDRGRTWEDDILVEGDDHYETLRETNEVRVASEDSDDVLIIRRVGNHDRPEDKEKVKKAKKELDERKAKEAKEAEKKTVAKKTATKKTATKKAAAKKTAANSDS